MLSLLPTSKKWLWNQRPETHYDRVSLLVIDFSSNDTSTKEGGGFARFDSNFGIDKLRFEWKGVWSILLMSCVNFTVSRDDIRENLVV